jgi:predicted  nucleic acid-binding Zn-ribbon protein
MFYVILGSQRAVYRDLLIQIFDVMGSVIPAAIAAKNYLERGASPKESVKRFTDIFLDEQNRLQREHEEFRQKYLALYKKYQDETSYFERHRIEISDAINRTTQRKDKECQARCDAMKVEWDKDKQALSQKSEEIEEMESEFQDELVNLYREIGTLKNQVQQLENELAKATRIIDEQNQVISTQQQRLKNIIDQD